jgi:hypothetical protein
MRANDEQSAFVAQGARDRRAKAHATTKEVAGPWGFFLRFNGGCKAITIPPNIEACRPHLTESTGSRFRNSVQISHRQHRISRLE